MEILKIIFTIILILDIPLAIASFIFAYILLFRRDWRNPIYFNFGMAILSMAIWLFITLLDFFRLTPFSPTMHAIFGFTISIWVLHFFLIFTYYYPIKIISLNLRLPIIYILTIIVSLSAFLSNLYVFDSQVVFPFRYRYMNPIGITIFIIYFSILAGVGLYNLFKNFEQSDGVNRIKIKKIMSGTSLAILANLFFSLVNYYYTPFDLTLFGMFSTITVLIYIYSILFSKD